MAVNVNVVVTQNQSVAACAMLIQLLLMKLIDNDLLTKDELREVTAHLSSAFTQEEAKALLDAVTRGALKDRTTN